MHKLRIIKCSALACVFFAPLSAQETRVSITNPSDIIRSNEPVIVSWAEVSGKLPNATPNRLRLVNEQGQSLAFQVDDLDLDGTPDELVFLTDLASKQRRSFVVKTVSEGQATVPVPVGNARADAENYKRINGVLQSIDDDDGPGLRRDETRYRFDGVGWESEIVGYRVYLDERNAVDIQGKRKPGLQWKHIGTTDVDYQKDSDWGMDILHVGPALGIGGIGFWVGDSVSKPYTLDRRRCRIIARGPIRAVVRVDYTGWVVGGDTVDVTSIFTICAGDRVSEHRVILRKGKLPKTLVTGIVKHPPANVVWDSKEGTLYTVGVQSRAKDQLLMALNVVPSSVLKKTEDGYNHLLLLKLELNKPVTFLISSKWQGETGQMWSAEQIRESLKQTSLRLTEPLRVQVL